MSLLSRKDFLLGASSLAATAALPSRALSVARRRRAKNLFILVDEWRAQAMRHMGDTNVRTPALD